MQHGTQGPTHSHTKTRFKYLSLILHFLLWILNLLYPFPNEMLMILWLTIKVLYTKKISFVIFIKHQPARWFWDGKYLYHISSIVILQIIILTTEIYFSFICKGFLFSKIMHVHVYVYSIYIFMFSYKTLLSVCSTSNVWRLFENMESDLASYHLNSHLWTLSHTYTNTF